ncbi:phage protein NinX family protein [Enterobacter asburiae]|uniref:phage protein NinX family protein n=1 Tax=Enterobacter asburiae TaxID=61645 RepID=UPI003B24E6EB
MDYSQLSDFEINKRVAEIVYSIEVVADDFYAKDVPFAYHKDGQVFIFIDEPLSGDWRSYNPCNNPADAWPIIVDNKIKIEPMRRVRNYNEWYEEWDASVNSPHFCESHKNPLRAAMIVFLLSQDDKHA